MSDVKAVLKTALAHLMANRVIKGVYYKYSGRSMCGRNCTGVVIRQYDSESEVMLKLSLTLYSYVKDVTEFEAAIMALGKPISDILGWDRIVYFPELDLEDTDGDYAVGDILNVDWDGSCKVRIVSIDEASGKVEIIRFNGSTESLELTISELEAMVN